MFAVFEGLQVAGNAQIRLFR